MEKRIMKKHLFGTILVLAALAACNKEVETPAPVVDNEQEEASPGKVTLTFKASIDEATRTTYEEDKIAHWAAGDAISVCVTDNESFDVVDFITNDGITFTGEVESGYTTIISGVYPANDVYSSSPNLYFEDGAVKSVYLPNSYDLEDADDTGRFIPLIGSYDGKSMTFRHFCSAMKVTLTNIPTDATVFTFTTKKQQISGDFSLSDGGRMTLANQDENSSVSFEFVEGSQETRSFYIPIPDGQLTAGSYVTIEKAIENSNNEVLFKKVINSTPTFPRTSDHKDAIRILPEVACWTRDDNWQVTYLYDLFNETKVKSYVRVSGTLGYYGITAFTKADFESSFDSIADFLLSINSSSHYTGNGIIKFNYKFSATDYIAIVYGLDKNNNFTGFYNCIDFTVPEFFTPAGWSITVNENYNNSGNIITVANVKVPEGNTWSFNSVSKEEFTNSYGGDPAAFIRSKRNVTSSLSTGKSVNYNVNSLRGDYVLISYGMNERASAEESRTPTFEYCLLEYTFEEPSLDYLSWLGTWTVTDSKSTPNVDTWTISRKQANHTYSVSGMNGNLFTAVANYDAINNRIVFQSQFVGSSNTYDYYLFGSGSDVNHAVRQTEEPYDLMYVEQTANGITLNGFTLPDNTLCARYYRLNYNRSTSAWTFTSARYIPSILTPAE